MDYYPTDTVDRAAMQEQTFDVQPNTPAPIVAYQSNGMAWLTARNVAIGVGGVVMLAIFGLLMQNSVTQPQTIKVSPVQEVKPNTQAVNALILEQSKGSLDELRLATDLKLEEVQKAIANERSQEILREAQRQVADSNSGCYRSPYGTACFITSYISEQNQRFNSAVGIRDWARANQALINIKAARVALDGTANVPFTPAVTAAAIARENEARINLAKQSDNALASEMIGGKQ